MWQTLAATRSCANARALPAHTLAPIVTRRAGIPCRRAWVGGGAPAPTRALASRAGCPKPARGAGAGVPLSFLNLANQHQVRYIPVMPQTAGPAAAGRIVSETQGARPMDDRGEMPSALQVARAVSVVLGRKLADQAAGEIVLTREEAALCLGLAEGVVENLEQSQGKAD